MCLLCLLHHVQVDGIDLSMLYESIMPMKLLQGEDGSWEPDIMLEVLKQDMQAEADRKVPLVCVCLSLSLSLYAYVYLSSIVKSVFLFFPPCNHSINTKKNLFVFLRRSKRQRNFFFLPHKRAKPVPTPPPTPNPPTHPLYLFQHLLVWN